MPALAQNATVTANLKLLSGGASQPTGTSIRVDLQNCAAPRVPGTGNVGEKSRTFYPSTFGVAFITLWSNGVLDCGAGVPVNPSQAPSFYTFNLVSNGGVTSLGSYKVPAGTSTLDTLTPINSVPVIPTPSGDNSYLRLDLSNFSNLVQPLPNLDEKLDNSVVIAGEYSSLNAASASCPLVGGCTIEVNTTVALSANLTLPSTTTLKFNQPGKITLGGQSLITASVVAAPYQIFSGAVTLGPQVSTPPVEWFGAVGDWNGSTGTDNTTLIQACLTSLTSGQCLLQARSYKVTAALTINRSNIGLKGSGVGIIVPGFVSPTTISSALYQTSATADFIDCVGTSTSASLGYNQFNDFALRRTVAPSATPNTAVGLRLSFVYGTIVNHLSIEDNNAGILFHAAGSEGLGAIENVAVTWGFGAVHETSGSFAGFFIDSSDGLPSPSLRIRNSLAASNVGTAAATFGLLSTGQALEDLHVTNLETAGVGVGEQFSVAGGATSELDVHLWNVINDTCLTSCMVFNSGLSTASTIEINGGWNFRSGTGTSPVIDFEGAFNATVANAVIYSPAAGSGPGIFINGGGKININGDTFLNGTNSAVSASGANFVSVTNNMMTNMNAGANSIIQFAGVNNGIVSNNEIGGSGAFGVSLDAATHGIAGLSTNTVNGTFTTSLNDLGINPTQPIFFSIGSGSIYKNRQQIRQTTSLCTASASGTCTFTLTWPTAFPDASWKGACTVETASGSGVITQIAASGKTTTTATVSFRDFSAASNTPSSVACEGWE